MIQDKDYENYKKEMILRDRLAMDRTVMANERTFLAYIRTSLSVVVVGASFIKFLHSPIFHIMGQGNRMRMPNKISTYKPRKLKTKGFSAKRGAAVDNGAHLKIALFFKGKRWSCNKIKTLHHAT